MLYISPPFGNYISYKEAIRIEGTFTWERRKGLIYNTIRSLRPVRGGWRNQIGFRNKGIAARLRSPWYPNKIISISAMKPEDWALLCDYIPSENSLELNLSCPNVERCFTWESAKVFTRSAAFRTWCIAKLSPLTTPEELCFIVEELGFTQLHFSNTLPFGDAGGISGPVLRRFTVELIEMCREKWGDDVEIIAGGGVRDFAGVMEYLAAGANHISFGSVCFNPFKLRKLLKTIEL